MSCATQANRISTLLSQAGTGLTQLAGKRAFYAGVALGGTGLLGAGLVALARRKVAQPPLKQEESSRQVISMRPIPKLPSRTRIKPLSTLSTTDRCASCSTGGRHQQGGWYALGSKKYCPDCAPEAARQADVELVVPESEVNGTDRTPSRSDVVDSAAYLSPERWVETRLAPSRMRLNVGQNPSGEPAWVVVEQGRVLLHPNGGDTGLAVTPALRIGQDREIKEDTSRWWLTHISSGKTLGNQPYGSMEEAQLLGNVLAQMDWTRDEHEITTREMNRVAETIRRYNQALAQEKGQPNVPDTNFDPRRLPANESLTGKLLADGYGGVSRVLEDNGDTLFMIDSLGKRYEVARNQIRRPDGSDFEMCRVAMSFDPSQRAVNCARCGQPSSQSGSDKWYRMSWQDFCAACAGEYAAEEGYIKDDEINTDLESM